MKCSEEKFFTGAMNEQTMNKVVSKQFLVVYIHIWPSTSSGPNIHTQNSVTSMTWIFMKLNIWCSY